MPLYANLLSRSAVSTAPQAQSALAPSTAGVAFTITRMLGSASSLSLLSGSNSNLTLSGNQISAASAISGGTTQTALVREVNGQLAVEYPVVLTGAATSPSTTPAALFDLDYTTGSYTQPTGTHPFAEQIGYSDGLFERKDGSLASLPAYSLRRTDRGLYSPPGYTNLVRNPRALAGAGWVTDANASVASDGGAAKRDGSGSASRVYFYAPNAPALQQLSNAAGTMAAYADVQAWPAGSATGLQMTVDGGTTWVDCDMSKPRYGGWCRAHVPAQTVSANTKVGFRQKPGGTGNQFAVDLVCAFDTGYAGGNGPNGDFEPIPTNDTGQFWPIRYSAFESTNSGLHAALRQTYTMLIDFSARRLNNLFTSATGAFVICGSNGLIFSPGGGSGGSVETANQITLSSDMTMTAVNRAAFRFDSASGAVAAVLNNGAIVKGTGAVPLQSGADHIDLMTNGSSAAQMDGLVRRLKIIPAAISDADMIAWASGS